MCATGWGDRLLCGILGLGEEPADRIALLHELANLDPQPESVPLNILAPVPGTPLQNSARVTGWELIRAVAVARIVLPRAKVRLSAGRESLSPEQQALCFLAGANSIHAGEKLLTVGNPAWDQDAALFSLLGLVPET